MSNSNNNDNHFKLRITPNKSGNANAFLDILTYIEGNAIAYAYVREGGNARVELHYHFYLVSNLSIEKLRYPLRKLLGTGGAKGNSVFSLSKLLSDDEYCLEYLSYMYKSKAPVFSSGIPKSILEQAQLLSETFRENKKQSAPKSIIKQLYLKFEEDFKYDPDSQRWLDDDSQCAHTKNVLTLVIDFFKSKDCLVRESSILCYTQTLLMKYDPIYPETLVSRLMEKLK